MYQEMNSYFGFKFTENAILLEKGWSHSVASLFGEINTERDVLEEVFTNGSDKDFSNLLCFIHRELNDKEKLRWATYIIVVKEWNERDLSLFNVCYKGDLETLIYKTFLNLRNIVSRSVDREKKVKKRKTRNKFIKAEDVNNETIEFEKPKEFYEAEKEKKLKERIDIVLNNLKQTLAINELNSHEGKKYLDWEDLTVAEFFENEIVIDYLNKEIINKARNSQSFPGRSYLKIENLEYERDRREKMKERSRMLSFHKRPKRRR